MSKIAVLIPCYNEAQTIEKVFMIIILMMARMKSHVKMGQWFVMKDGKEKEM